MDSDAVVFRLSRPRLVGLIGLAIVLAGGSALSLVVALSGDGTAGTRAFIAVLGLAFGAVAIWAITYATRRLRQGNPPIVIGPFGLLDTMILSSPLPWPEIRRPRIRYSGIAGWRLLFDVDPDAEERLAVPVRQRRSAARRTAFGAAGYRVFLFGTDATPVSMRIALGRYVALDQGSFVSRILGRD